MAVPGIVPERGLLEKRETWGNHPEERANLPVPDHEASAGD